MAKKKAAWLAGISDLRVETLTSFKYFTSLRGEASSDSGAAPKGLPFLQGSNKTRVGLDAGTFAFYETIRIVKGHALIADEVRDDNGGAS
jgi:hypothetical protein